MKKIIVICCFVVSYLGVSAQSLNPSLISCSGTSTVSLPSINVQISYSIGEVVVANGGTCGSSKPIINQGFQEPDATVSCISGIAEIRPLSSIMKLYPNPSTGVFNIRFNETKPEKMGLRVYDMEGKLILVQEDISINAELNLSAQAKGIYFVNVYMGNEQYFEKVCVQ